MVDEAADAQMAWELGTGFLRASFVFSVAPCCTQFKSDSPDLTPN
jgi:hypothetical protein